VSWLVAGLGNPGSKYQRNRHNVGFMVVEELARKAGFSAWKTGAIKGAEITSGMVGRTKCVLMKPLEFMNLSGFAVQRAMAFHGIDIAKLLVVHDEIDLDFGIVRLKQGGGHGGHNGLRSIMEQLGEGDDVHDRSSGPAGQRPGRRWVISCSTHWLPSGSLNPAYDE